MTKAELVDRISDHVSGSSGDPLTKADVARVFDATVTQIADTLAGGGEVVLGNEVGRFTVEHRNARQGMNPATGEKQMYPAKNVVKFKPSRQLKERVA